MSERWVDQTMFAPHPGEGAGNCLQACLASLTRRRLKAPIPLHEIAEQRAKGWPDFHPEDYCHRCGAPNVGSWHVDHARWREAFPHDAIEAATGQTYSSAEKAFNGIVCPSCFVELHERAVGLSNVWSLRTDTGSGVREGRSG